MFKVYCHMSSLTQCYTILINPLTLLIIKKKIHLSRPRAGAKSRSILLLRTSILPLSVPTWSTRYPFLCSLNPHWGSAPFLLLIRYDLLLLAYGSHLASISTIPFSRLRLRQTRLRLKQLNNPRGPLVPRSQCCSLASLVLAVCSLGVTPCFCLFLVLSS
jgi:hypothetical protein